MSPLLFLSCFFVYVIGMIIFGWWMTRKPQTGDDFLLGGRSLPMFLTLGTTLATMVGTGSSMGAVGKAYSAGWMGSLYGIGGAAGIIVIALVFAPVRNHRFMTMAEELSSYVGANRVVSNLVAIFTYLACVGWLGAHIKGGGAYLEFVTKIDATWAMISIAAGFGIYSLIGGYRAVVWTDTVQAVVLFCGFVATAVVALQMTGGFAGIQSVNRELQVKAGGFGLGSISLIVAIGVGVLGTPSFRQRIYSGNSIKEIRKAFIVSGFLYLLFAAFPAVIGMAAFKANPDLANQDQAFPWMATQSLPVVLGIITLLAGLSATMSSASSDAISGVTTVVRDLYQMVFRKVPPAHKVVGYSRWALAITTLLALTMALGADNILDYIKKMIGLFMAGMCVCGLLGRCWDRYNAPGAVASLVGAFLTALSFEFMTAWDEYWGGNVIPTLIVSATLGVVVSLLTPPDKLSAEEAIARLAQERAEMSNGEKPKAVSTENEV